MKQPSLKKNYIYKLFYEVLTIITPLITAPYVSRVLKADGVGIYSYSLSLMTFFTLVAALGTVSYGTREIAQHRNSKLQYSKLFWEIEILSLTTTGLCLLGWTTVICWSKAYKYYFIALIPQLLAVAADISWFYTGLEKIGYTVFWNSVCKILGVIGVFIFVKEKSDLLVYMLIISGSHFLGNFSMWFHLRKLLVKIDKHTLSIKRHFRETLIYFVPAAATSIYTVLDKTLIGIITKSDYQNGYYEQATKIINICKTVAFTSVNAVMKARMSFLFSEGKTREVKDRLKKSMDFILMLGFGCVGGIIAIANNLVPWFFGAGYDEVIPLVYLMSPLIVIIGVSNCLGAQYYTPSGQRKRSAKIIIIGAITNLCMNLILIPRLSSYGAVIGSIVAELLISVLYVRKCEGFITGSLIAKLSCKRIIAAAVMAICVYAVGKYVQIETAILIIIQMFSGVTIYGLLLLLMRDKLIVGLVNTFLKTINDKDLL